MQIGRSPKWQAGGDGLTDESVTEREGAICGLVQQSGGARRAGGGGDVCGVAPHNRGEYSDRSSPAEHARRLNDVRRIGGKSRHPCVDDRLHRRRNRQRIAELVGVSVPRQLRDQECVATGGFDESAGVRV